MARASEQKERASSTHYRADVLHNVLRQRLLEENCEHDLSSKDKE
jgi:hypothetical protein